MPKRNEVRTNKLPPLGIQDTLKFNVNLQQIQSQFRDMMGQVRLQSAATRSDFRRAREGIRSALISSLSEAEGAAIERGALGSSTDFQERIGRQAEASAALAEARAKREQTLAQLQMQRQLLGREKEMSLINLQAQRRASQAQQNIEDFLNNVGGAGGFFGGGGGGASPGQIPGSLTPAAKGVEGLSTRLEKLLFRLGNIPKGDPRRRKIVRNLRQAWRKRNRLRKRLGMKTVSAKKLNKAIQQATSNVPHGRI